MSFLLFLHLASVVVWVGGMFFAYFWDRVKAVKGDHAGENFIAITDPGTSLEALAKLKPAFAKFKKRVDYSEYGGAPLLGLNGISIISHGRSSGKAIKNAIRVAKEFHENEINQHIHEGIEENLSLFRERQQKNNKTTVEA